MLKIGQNWGEITNYPPNAQQRLAPLIVAIALFINDFLDYRMCIRIDAFVSVTFSF